MLLGVGLVIAILLGYGIMKLFQLILMIITRKGIE